MQLRSCSRLATFCWANGRAGLDVRKLTNSLRDLLEALGRPGLMTALAHNEILGGDFADNLPDVAGRVAEADQPVQGRTGFKVGRGTERQGATARQLGADRLQIVGKSAKGEAQSGPGRGHLGRRDQVLRAGMVEKAERRVRQPEARAIGELLLYGQPE